MADSKKYNGSTWQHSLRKLGTGTDTITTLPVDIYADGNNATVGLKGNTVQNGTPTPDNPIMPQGTGERTTNLMHLYKTGYAIDVNGNEVENSAFNIYEALVDTSVLQYTLAGTSGASNRTIRIHEYNGDTWLSQVIDTTGANLPITFTKSSTANRILISIYANNYNMRLTASATSMPYEPYGYKIPISSASTTTPVYLGEAETTRRVKKLVLTGEESWGYYGQFGTGNHKHFYVDLGEFATIPMTNDILLCCNTYAATNNVNNIGNYCCRYQQTSNNRWNINRVYFTNDDYNSLNDVINALSNNPIILYVIATQETTGIVNEPLMKIGDYADTVSGITVPTITGKDAFDVETTLKPSEVSLSYTGWHDATVKEWDGSQWNE